MRAAFCQDIMDTGCLRPAVLCTQKFLFQPVKKWAPKLLVFATCHIDPLSHQEKIGHVSGWAAKGPKLPLQRNDRFQLKNIQAIPLAPRSDGYGSNK